MLLLGGRGEGVVLGCEHERQAYGLRAVKSMFDKRDKQKKLVDSLPSLHMVSILTTPPFYQEQARACAVTRFGCKAPEWEKKERKESRLVCTHGVRSTWYNASSVEKGTSKRRKEASWGVAADPCLATPWWPRSFLFFFFACPPPRVHSPALSHRHTHPGGA